MYTTSSIIIHLVSQYQRKTGVHSVHKCLSHQQQYRVHSLNSPQNKLLKVSRFFIKPTDKQLGISYNERHSCDC